jgi:hypothetical protein
MTTSILVTGGTGTLGRPVAQPLRPGPQQRPAATPHQPITKGAAVTAGRCYCRARVRSRSKLRIMTDLAPNKTSNDLEDTHDR